MPPFGSPIRAMHIWVDQNAVERLAILCEEHLYVLEGPDQPGRPTISSATSRPKAASSGRRTR